MSDSQEMTVVEHLAELRRRIIWVLVVFLFSMGIGLYYAGDVIEYLKASPLAGGVPLKSFDPSDVLRVYMQFSFVIGLIITLPVALFHMWRFVSPGLRPQEKRVTLSFIPAAFFLFLIGLAFGYFVVFPMIMQFMTGIAMGIQIDPNYGIAQYFGFLFNMVIPFGFLFELPILVIFLTRLRILNPMRLAKMRRFAYFGLTVVAVTLTPPEILSDIMVTIPLLLLYEMSIWLSRMVYRKQLQEDKEWQQEFGYDTE
ncbi:twin-arginine translocase subunit TatC [Brevibacillus sp. SYP-B805]|uniref:twin-arginine translocase subunit TatC n=1 Tax=Brevibacillus sp. SYP-B805 TaxID=1578199 RepID=UPI0013ED04CA|nr:twin-arginine translocase subunit TatC [Brevibacillus sp. SYP-B805]NGQ96071.1 twin-arginine translocase subunit TatC [Brevibacillus sp. SYP-B805]